MNFGQNEDGYFQYWQMLKDQGDIEELETVSIKLQKVCALPSVCTNSWVNALFKHSEMIVLKGNKYSNTEDKIDPDGIYSTYIEEAIKTLKRISLVLPPLPMPILHTIKDPILIKEEILNNLRKDERQLTKENIKETQDNEKSFLGFSMKKIINKESEYGSLVSKSDVKSRLSDVSDIDMMRKYSNRPSEVSLNFNLIKSEGGVSEYSSSSLTKETKMKVFKISSDVKFLYQIGKICAESGKYLEEGIKCLDDYINLLTYFDPAVNADIMDIPVSENPMFSKAVFFVGVIFNQIGDYDEAERFLIQAKVGLEENKERSKLEK